MDQADRDIIRSNIGSLSDDMDFESVSTFLYSKCIFEKGHIEAFAAKENQKKRNLELLLDIETRGPKAFRCLVEALLAAKQPFLAEKLGYSPPTHSEVQVQASTSHEPVWPPRDNSGDYSSTQMDASTSYPQSMVDSDMVYKMKSRPRGIALIMNNKTFKTLKKRSGTDADCRNLENVFKQLGFHVVIHRDLKGRDIQQMTDQLRRYNHSQFDCFIFAILTHGIEGAIYGTDEYLVKIEDIVHQFSSDRCPTLKGKPKLFFLQADRGERFDEGVEEDDSAAAFEMSCEGDYFFNYQPDAKLDDDKLLTREVKEKLAATDSFASTQSKMKIPSQSNVLLPHAALPERFDEGVEADDSAAAFRMSCKGDYFFNYQPDAKLDDDKLVKLMLEMELDATDSFASTRSKIKIPSHSDMLLAYATVPGFVTWRNSERGTWFIQALTEVILQYAKTEDLLSMMTMVNSRVARAFESSSGRYKQMPAPVSMLTKKLYFFPGRYK